MAQIIEAGNRCRTACLSTVFLYFLIFSFQACPRTPLFVHEPEAGTWLHYGDSWILLRDFDPGQTAMAMMASSLVSLLPLGAVQTMRSLDLAPPGLSTVAGWGGNALGMISYFLVHQGTYSRLPENRSEHLLSRSSYLAPIEIVGESLSSSLRLSLYKYGNDWPMLDLSYLPGSRGKDYKQGGNSGSDLLRVARFMGLTGIKRIQIRLSAHSEHARLVISTLRGGDNEWRNFFILLPGQHLWNITDIPQLAAWMLTPKVMNAVIYGAMAVNQHGFEEGDVVFKSSFFTVRQGRSFNDFNLEPRVEYMIPAPDPYGLGLVSHSSVERQVWSAGGCTGSSDLLCTGLMTLSGGDRSWPLNHDAGNSSSKLHYIAGPIRISEIDLLLESQAGQSPYYEIPSWAMHAALVPVQIGINYLLYRLFDDVTSALLETVEKVAPAKIAVERGPKIHEETEPVVGAGQTAKEARKARKEAKKARKEARKIRLWNEIATGAEKEAKKAKKVYRREQKKGAEESVLRELQDKFEKLRVRALALRDGDDIIRLNPRKHGGTHETCPICRTDYAEEYFSSPVRRLSCHHVYHQDCIQGYLNNGGFLNYECPTCRKHIPFFSADSDLMIGIPAPVSQPSE